MAPSAGTSAPASSPSHLQHTLKGHVGPVHVVRYNTGSRYLISGGSDRTIRLWNPSSGTFIKSYSGGGHAYEVLGLAVAPGNDRFASCGGDRSVFLWDVMSGGVLRRFSGHSGRVNAVEFEPSRAELLCSAGYDGTVRAWDLRSQVKGPIQTLDEAKDSVTSLVIGGDLIVAGCVDGNVRTYDMRMGQLRTDFVKDPVTSISLSAAHDTLLVSTLSSPLGVLRLLDLSNGTLLQTFTDHSNSSYRIHSCFGWGEQTVLAGAEDGSVWAWDVLSGKAIGSGPGMEGRAFSREVEGRGKAHDKTVLWVEQSTTKKGEVATAGADGAVKLWTDGSDANDSANG